MSICSICGFEQREGETHRQIQVVPSTRDADDDVLITCIVKQDRYVARIDQQKPLPHSEAGKAGTP